MYRDLKEEDGRRGLRGTITGEKELMKVRGKENADALRRDRDTGVDRALSFDMKNYNAQAWVDVRALANVAHYYREVCGGTARVSEIVRWTLNSVHDMILKKDLAMFFTVPEAIEYLEDAGFSTGQYSSGRQRTRRAMGVSMAFEETEVDREGIEAYSGRVKRATLMKGIAQMPTRPRRERTPEDEVADQKTAHFMQTGYRMEKEGLLTGLSDKEQGAAITAEHEKTYKVAPSQMVTRPSDDDKPRTRAEQEAIDKAQMQAMKEALRKPPTLANDMPK